MRRRRRRICFVTGTRAEFGLMQSALHAIRSHPSLELQIIATGMHLDRRRGYSLRDIFAAGFKVDSTVWWSSRGVATPHDVARHTSLAMYQLETAFAQLRSDIVLVVGDRVEAFAAAAAGHLCGRIVAHVHGGDRALGQVDDALRHAITKLAHIHFPATRDSAKRLRKLGEDAWRIHLIGSPGIDGIVKAAATREQLRAQRLDLPPRRFALLVLHPVEADEAFERRRASETLAAVQSSGIDKTVIVYPNNDPGGGGIVAAWRAAQRKHRDLIVLPNLARPMFLGLLRDAAVLVGNSSAGIIEAGSFGTPVVNIGPRQLGRERGQNVTDVPYGKEPVTRAVRRIWNRGKPLRFPRRNVYGGGAAGEAMARVLAEVSLDQKLGRKLIAY